MASVVNKIIVIIVAGMVALVIWYVAVPFMKDLQQGSLEQQVTIEALSDEKNPVAMTVGTSTIYAEIVATDDERAKGLSGRFFIGDEEGMLFVFREPGYHAIWMKDMLFPIDIAWLDKDFKIIDIEREVSPSTYPSSFSPQAPATYVLEVNAGFFEEKGISIGNTFQLKAE